MDEAQTKETYSAGGVVLNTAGQVLVVSQNGDSWSLPKGRIDPGEDAITAARREIHEESGVSDLKFVDELGVYKRYRLSKDGGESKTELKSITMFLFTTTQTDLAPLDPHNPEARWVNKEKVAELLTHPKDKDYFNSIIERL
ncbi:MAG: NUDIX domain-containing protein [Candidatus Komeilibacteria bacterium]|nr:NUDIX domain-containing protein [Candidatus Komeilibacteria bacterium]